MTMKALALVMLTATSYVQSFTAVRPQQHPHASSFVSSPSTVLRWMTTSNDDAASKKDPIEVVEDYRDNLSNSRTAPGHHDGQEKKVQGPTNIVTFFVAWSTALLNFEFFRRFLNIHIFRT